MAEDKYNELEWFADELRLVERMIGLACEGEHGTAPGTLCADCAGLLDYVQARLQRCPHGRDKPTCRQCPIHCYHPTERDRIKAVMKYAGPRLLLRGDLAALKHLLHDRKGAPPKKTAE
jgi:hypothetical protein